MEDIPIKTPLFAILALLAVLIAPAHAQVPDDRAVVQAALNGFDLRTHDGQAAFVDAAVCALNQRNPRWGHLRKNPGQTAIHGHGEDVALYLSDTPGQSIAVDFVAGAGGPNPSVGWGLDIPRYSPSDWLPPHNCGVVSPQPTPTPAPTPVDLTPILERLAAIESVLSALADSQAATQNAVVSVREAVRAIVIPSAPTYTGKVLGFPVTLRPSTP